MPRTLYQIIGCLPTANDHEIKRAYRRLSKRYHPDLNPHDPQAATKFIELQQAYELLIDPARRAAYDATLAHAASEFGTTNRQQSATYTYSYPYQQPVASKRRRHRFSYRFFPGIGAALMFALIRMFSGNHSEIYKEPVVTYYSATPVGSNDPQNNHCINTRR